MKRIITLTLTLALLISVFAFPASAAEKLDVLDPSRLIRVYSNRCYNASGKNNYDMYNYDFYADSNEVRDFIMVYEEQMEKIGFVREESESKVVAYRVFFYDHDELAVIMSVKVNRDLSGKFGRDFADWNIMLMVLDGYELTRDLIK